MFFLLVLDISSRYELSSGILTMFLLALFQGRQGDVPHFSVLFPYIELNGTNYGLLIPQVWVIWKCLRGAGAVNWVHLRTASVGPSFFQYRSLQIEIESLWGQQSESLDPVAFFHPVKVSLFPVNLFDYKIERSSREWPLELKRLTTGFSSLRCLISDQWPFIQCGVHSPFYQHTVSCILYIRSHRPR